MTAILVVKYDEYIIRKKNYLFFTAQSSIHLPHIHYSECIIHIVHPLYRVTKMVWLPISWVRISLNIEFLLILSFSSWVLFRDYCDWTTNNCRISLPSLDSLVTEEVLKSYASLTVDQKRRIDIRRELQSIEINSALKTSSRHKNYLEGNHNL